MSAVARFGRKRAHARRVAAVGRAPASPAEVCARLRLARRLVPSKLGRSTLQEANGALVLASLEARRQTASAVQALDAALRQSQRDALTGLPNRLLLTDRLAQAIGAAQRHGDKVALLFVDIDGFKQINDRLGHAAGDAVLMEIAGRLRASVRQSDTVSRHGGDEFLVLLPEIGQFADAVTVADTIVGALARPLPAGPELLQISASIGIGIYPDDALDPEGLIARADAAMYGVKQSSHVAADRRDASGGQRANLQEVNEQLVLQALNSLEERSAATAERQTRSDMLATIVHELRSPLQSIKTASAVIAKTTQAQPALQQLNEIIGRQATQMARLVGDLLDVSHTANDRLGLQMRPLGLGAVIDDAFAGCRLTIEDRNQRLRLPPVAPEVLVYGDAVRLVQVVRNLLDNASKYTPHGGALQLTVLRKAVTVEISVSDSGIGIDSAILPRIFEPFIREDRAVEVDGEGLGLGLSIVRQLVLAHAGSVVAHSEGRDLGSTFVVTLPLLPPTEAGGSHRQLDHE